MKNEMFLQDILKIKLNYSLIKNLKRNVKII